ncbi:hypothetical protein BCR44DRAFT_1283017 [Catenaria anguillulae PL171]|uniref:Uncharacterized protein n=1 Tax=Catenaria anguillulae PL171 TaxID=765915 RepID=A0A1Y2HWG8_9FUNG|nr:hypothetical protein BCR44DRAFT_1283017 [Catenaria anguillulae PL171]
MQSDAAAIYLPPIALNTPFRPQTLRRHAMDPSHNHIHEQANDRSLDADIQLVERGISLLRRQLDTSRRDQLVLQSLRDRAARDTQGFVDDLVAG